MPRRLDTDEGRARKRAYERERLAKRTAEQREKQREYHRQWRDRNRQAGKKSRVLPADLITEAASDDNGLMSFDEIAAELGLRKDQVYREYCRAIRKLRKAAEELR